MRPSAEGTAVEKQQTCRHFETYWKDFGKIISVVFEKHLPLTAANMQTFKFENDLYLQITFSSKELTPLTELERVLFVIYIIYIIHS